MRRKGDEDWVNKNTCSCGGGCAATVGRLKKTWRNLLGVYPWDIQCQMEGHRTQQGLEHHHKMEEEVVVITYN